MELLRPIIWILITHARKCFDVHHLVYIAAAVYQRQLSVPSVRGRSMSNEHQRKLGSKRAYHAMHWPRIRGLAASAGVRLRAKETEISASPLALKLGKGHFRTPPSCQKDALDVLHPCGH